jgi:putative Ca2+/H+ antiporter (TMEM165/GDT1 family)
VETFAVSAIAVALGEIGDKTQLLALMLAMRFRRPWPIITGILVATLLNHTIAGAIGNWIRSVITPEALKWVLSGSFLGVAAWSLRADSRDDDAPIATHLGVFAVTAVAFFFAEMGDKTQIATLMLAARFESLAAVVAGTTLGMLVADVPVVFAGKLAADRIPFKAMRIVAASLFAALGIWVLIAGIPPSSLSGYFQGATSAIAARYGGAFRLPSPRWPAPARQGWPAKGRGPAATPAQAPRQTRRRMQRGYRGTDRFGS